MKFTYRNAEVLSELVAPKFEELKWDWIFDLRVRRIPNVVDIENLFSNLVDTIKEGNCTKDVCGGLIAFMEDDVIYIDVSTKLKKKISKTEVSEMLAKLSRTRLLRPIRKGRK